jgi:excisionase family DNA binding protein
LTPKRNGPDAADTATMPTSAQTGASAMTPSLPAWLPRRLMGVNETAELLQQSPRQVWRLISDGRLRVFRLGRSVRVSPEAIAEFLGVL